MLCIFLACVLANSGAASKLNTRLEFSWDTTKYVYAFGDSYSFVQGTAGLANFSFIGDAFHLGFTPAQLLENEIVPKNTSSDGSNWLEFLTGCSFGRPSDCPIQLWDFAFAGADIDASILPLHHNFSVDLVDQVRQWKAYAAPFIPHPRNETLVAWWIGINDTGDTLNNRTITNFTAFWEIEMTSYFRAVQSAHDAGLGGTYLFLNVPPEDRAPGHLAAPTLMKQRILDYNAVLATHVSTFAVNNPDVNVLTFDAHAWFGKVLDAPGAFGFRNVTGFCTCDDDTFFWYNTGHPTQRVHQLLAGAIKRQLQA
ncbi:carbohydrate esterase family 16 protein [Plicaturopsis crispa FD-325 SS-3]|nr:carbohydrate esterase family 16 protein [Plicaturopsis crispa FD-325 SS-3]